MSGIINNDSPMVKGFIQVELVNKVDGVRRVIKNNTVTDIGKLLMLSKSASNILMGGNGSLYGSHRAIDNLGAFAGSSSWIEERYPEETECLNVYLANLPTNEVLDGQSKFFNIFDNNFDIDDNKVVGFANNKFNTGNIKEGVVDFTKSEFMSEDNVVANRWVFREGVGTGEFNHIVMAPGMLGNLKCNGMHIKKNIDRCNHIEVGDKMSTGFIIPGAIGLTGPNEVLLNYERGGIKRWRYNLVTGETNPVGEDEVAYNFPIDGTSCQQIYHDGKLYVMRDNRRLDYYNTSTGTIINAIHNSIVGNTDYGCGMYIDGDKLVVMGSFDREEGSMDNNGRISEFNLSNMSKIREVNKVDYDGWGGIPNGYSRNRMIVRKVGGFYYINHNYETIKCTDIKNISSTIVNVYLSNPRHTHYVNVGGDVWTIEKGINMFNAVGFRIDKNSSRLELSYRKVNRSNGVDMSLSSFNSEGVWISKEMCGNLLSFVKLASPINKGPNDIMYVSYGYKFV